MFVIKFFLVKGKKKGKKEPTPPPEPGPWLHKLHLADNGIDSFDQGDDDIQLSSCIKVIRRLVCVYTVLVLVM